MALHHTHITVIVPQGNSKSVFFMCCAWHFTTQTHTQCCCDIVMANCVSKHLSYNKWTATHTIISDISMPQIWINNAQSPLWSANKTTALGVVQYMAVNTWTHTGTLLHSYTNVPSSGLTYTNIYIHVPNNSAFHQLTHTCDKHSFARLKLIDSALVNKKQLCTSHTNQQHAPF